MKQAAVYIPLWKQWRDSKEFAEYKKNELASVNKRMDEFKEQLKVQKERNDLMANEFNVRWVDASSNKVQETKHKNEKAAKDKARDLSFSNSPVQVGEVDEKGKLLAQWNYEKGKQQVMDTKKQVTVAPISKKEASSLKSNETSRKEDTPMTKTAKKANPKAAKKATGNGKAKHVPANSRSQSAAKSSGKETKKTGTIRDSFGLREGTVRAKLVDALLDAKGKPVAISAILKAMYGAAKDEYKGPLNMSLKGMQQMIDKNKIKLQIVKAKDEKGATIALKSK